ncbi:restriction endonuclease [Kineococcus sp. TRM81007]|uniref:restriction endonuclease n=1 Tax=Kineococcus sp. TRM81007 TaxID=2925831 RepID=UPI001F5854DE|nr:restriction endonuclease [Kineococcus sp. TRM81007]MCI2238098.1 restriction endonuclease [Kineococcus sp. TRM81007]
MKFAVALFTVLALSGTAGAVRAWLAIWSLLLTLAGALLVVVLTWRVVALRRSTRRLAAHQDALDRQLATTDGISGLDFEQVVARLLHRDGWHQVSDNAGAGDLGVDVSARHPVDHALYVTISSYSRPAQALAASSGACTCSTAGTWRPGWPVSH